MSWLQAKIRRFVGPRLWWALLAAARPMTGDELARIIRVPAAFVYPELGDLLDVGSVVDGWSPGFAPRRFYMLARRAGWLDEYGLVPRDQAGP